MPVMPNAGGPAVRTWTNAGAPVNGTTLANIARKGDLLTDNVNGKLYINTGTQAAPTWTVVGSQV